MRTALDSNVLMALINGEPTAAAVAARLGEIQQQGPLVICGAVYAELLAGQGVTPNDLQTLLKRTRTALETEASLALWEQAGLAFNAYAERRRRSDGSLARRLLADFLVGAHANLSADQLFTLDPHRYTLAFPQLKLVEL